MDRVINYPGQVPLETDLLQTNRFALLGLAKLAAAVLGTNTQANGFVTTQTTVPSLAVSVGAGEVYALASLDATAYSSLAADTTHQVFKQGVNLDAVTLVITPPGTAGQSINYLVQVTFSEVDGGAVVLPYYNASNPATAYSGPGGTGASQYTLRQGKAVVSLKAGTAATTGTQATPSPDAGNVGLYVVTVANGASTVVNANIAPYSSAPVLGANSPMFGQQSLGTNGFQKLPGGLILQWGTYSSNLSVATTGATTPTVINFPTPFPANCFNVSMTAMNAGNDNNADSWPELISKALGSFTMVPQNAGASGTAWVLHGFSWMALGN